MMLVDCTTCPVRDVHCADCMVTALTTPAMASLPLAAGSGGLPAPAEPAADGAEAGLSLDRAERRAVSVLLGAGLVNVEVANAARAIPSAGFDHGRFPASMPRNHQRSSRAAG